MAGDAQSVEILLVEDSPTDADLTIRALHQGELQTGIHHVKDGVEAMTFLQQESPYENAVRPDLILLDLNMPRMDGREVLRAIRDDDDLTSIPIVVLTTSSEEQDVATSYGLHTNAYIVKPVDLKQFFDVIREVDEFWFHVVTLPPSHR